MNQREYFGKRPGMGEMLLQHVIVVLICFVFPGATTFMAPASWVTFERTGESVSCKTKTCMYFVVPYNTQTIEHVSEITKREKAGGTKREVKMGRDTGRNVTVDGQGFLQIRGAGEEMIEVSVSPVSLENAVKKSREFLDTDGAQSTTIFVIANWKFGALMGGVLTAFTALCVIGYTLEFLKFLFRTSKSMFVGK